MGLVVTGAAGMLGRRVVADARERGLEVTGIDIDDLDLTDTNATLEWFLERHPGSVINCAAWTDVDGAEEREADALRVNEGTAESVAAAAAACGARLVHVSTDYVFDGTKTEPYVESDPVAPIGAYGRTKLASERAVAANCDDHAIARTAWLYGAGGKNFCDTMLGLAADRDEVSVVTDQVGSPTWTGHLSPALIELALGEARGVFHTAGAGQVSWYGLTVELFRQAGVDCRVNETTSAEFRRPAPRPAWSVMASERPETPRLPRWEDGVREFLAAKMAA